MALKRICGIHDKKANKCLECGEELGKKLYHGEEYECPRCKTKQRIFLSPQRVILVRSDREDLMKIPSDNPLEDKIFDLEREVAVYEAKVKILEEEVKELQSRLKEAQKKEQEWEKAADDLAKMVEQAKQSQQ